MILSWTTEGGPSGVGVGAIEPAAPWRQRHKLWWGHGSSAYNALIQAPVLPTVVGQNPPTGVDMQHKSWEAQRLYLLALQLTRALRLKFVGRATWPLPGQEGV
jgi:hypothetical protein